LIGSETLENSPGTDVQNITHPVKASWSAFLGKEPMKSILLPFLPILSVFFLMDASSPPVRR
jgi:hypothetical protein